MSTRNTLFQSIGLTWGLKTVTHFNHFKKYLLHSYKFLKKCLKTTYLNINQTSRLCSQIEKNFIGDETCMHAYITTWTTQYYNFLPIFKHLAWLPKKKNYPTVKFFGTWMISRPLINLNGWPPHHNKNYYFKFIKIVPTIKEWTILQYFTVDIKAALSLQCSNKNCVTTH